MWPDKMMFDKIYLDYVENNNTHLNIPYKVKPILGCFIKKKFEKVESSYDFFQQVGRWRSSNGLFQLFERNNFIHN